MLGTVYCTHIVLLSKHERRQRFHLHPWDLIDPPATHHG